MVLCAGEVDCNTKQDMLFLDYYFLVTTSCTIASWILLCGYKL